MRIHRAILLAHQVVRFLECFSTYNCEQKNLFPVTVAVNVLTVYFLKFLRNCRNSSGFPFSKIVILNLHVSDPDDSGLHIILNLIMSQALSSSFSGLDRGMGGGSIRACMSSSSQLGSTPSFMIG